MNSFLRSISSYLVAVISLAVGSYLFSTDEVLIDFNFQSTSYPTGVYTSPSIDISPNKAADGVCTQGMVQVNKEQEFYVDLKSLSYLQLNIKSTNTSSERTIRVSYKKEGESSYTAIETLLRVSTARAVLLHEDYPELVSSTPISVRIMPVSGNIQIHDILAKGPQVLSNDASIHSFKLDQQISSSIDDENGIINVVVPQGLDLSNVVPAIFVTDDNATVVPNATTPQNFVSPVTYTVTAKDGTTIKEYTVNVSTVSSSLKEITKFQLLPNQIGNASVNEEDGIVTVTVPTGESLVSIVPSIFEFSPFATISPDITAAQNFSANVTYTITAQNGSTKQWTIKTIAISNVTVSKIYEAEDADFTGKVDTQHTGFSGTGFVDFQANGENQINFTVCQVEAGAYQAKFKYALGKNEERTGRLYVNDYYVTTLNFNPGSSFSDWKEEVVVLNLNSGINNITIYWEQTDGPNLDHLELQGTACNEFTISYTTTNNGEITLSPARKNNTYFENEMVSVLAVSTPSVRFNEWGGELSGNENPKTITVTKNTNFTASFNTVSTYQLNVAVEGIGSVTLNPAGGVYPEGTSVTLTATGALNNNFLSWKGDVTGSNATNTIVMDGNKNITASFSNDLNLNFDLPVGFASVVTTEYANFNGPTTGGQNATDTLWINGPSDFNTLATALYNRNRAYKYNRVENDMKPAPLVIVFKEGVYPEGVSSSSAWGNHMMTIQEQGDLTLIGQGNVVLNWGFNIKRSWNIIIRNLSFQDYYDDGINIGEPETHHIWIDHCTVGHPTTRPTNQEHPDGGIDIKSGASYVTISWTKYQNSWKTGLVGHSDGNGSEDLGKLKVTYFANHFYNSNSRNPRVRFGEVHVLNNLTEKVSLYGIAASNQSQVFAEGNFYKDTRWPMYADRTTTDFKAVYGNNSDNGFTSKTGNKEAKGLKILNNEYDDSGLPVITSQINADRLNPGGRSVKFDEFNPQNVFTPPYTYEAFPASVVKTIVPLFAGAGVVDFFKTNETPEEPEPELVLPYPPNNGIIAFPGAEGYGKYATGGRGGKVVAVTNLNDSGPGSFRDALTQHPNDPLTIVFNVGGVINLASDIKINRSNLTIAGQTAPGEGICLTGASLIINGARSIQNGGNHGNIIIRYIRSRPMSNDPNGKYGIGLENVQNVILDHCSFSWANEENAAIYDNKFTTVQWSIISEGLWSAGHSKGTRSYGGVWGGQYASYHHNLLAHNNGRTIRFNGARAHDTIALVDYRNNVVYNWGTEGHATGGEIEIPNGVSRINLVNNYYKPGPATPSRRNFIRPNTPSNDKVGKFYLNGNVMHGNADMSADNKLGVTWNSGFEGLANTNIAAHPFDVAVNLPIVSALDAYNAVLANAGATLPMRDTVDRRIVEDTRNGTATGMGTRNLLGIIDDPSVVGGLPDYTTTTVVVDTDGDGIPDAYEVANNLNPNDPSDGNLLNNAGYTNLEIYLNSIVTSEEGENPPAIAKPISATWSLLSTQAATTVSDEITAFDQTVGSNLGAIQFASSYSGTEKIWQRVALNNGEASLYNTNNYIDFKIQHKEGAGLVIDSFSVALAGGGTGNARVNLLYSIDEGVTFLPLASTDNMATYNGNSTLAYSEDGVDPGNHVTLLNSSAVGAAGGNEFLRIGKLNLNVPAGKSITIRILGYLRAQADAKHIGMHSAYIGGKTIGAAAPTTPGVEVIHNLKNFNQVLPNASAIQNYKIAFKHTEDPVNIAVTAPFELSLNGTSWSNQLDFTPTENPDTATVSIRLNASATGTQNGTITHTFTGGFDAVTIPLLGNVLQPGSVNPNVIVAADGTGDFTSVQAAIDAAPSNRTEPWVIFIKDGKYREKVQVPQNKTFIHLVGESVANTILSWDDYSGRKLPNGTEIGTSTSYTLHVRGNDFAAANITIENTYGNGSQAVAVHVQADRTVFKNCRFLGNQDTLLVNGNGYKQYFVNCYIDGNVDYIFGSAIAVFESCVIYSKTRSANGNSYITAANTPSVQEHGLVFRNSEMPSNRGKTLYVFGRPWQNGTGDTDKAHNKTVFINTKIGANLIDPAGWSVWNAGTETNLIHYAEYGSINFDGTPVDVSQRVNWSKQLTEAEANEYTNANIFGSWDPCAVLGGVCQPFSADIAVSNFEVEKVQNKASTTWNISWPLNNVKYELFKSIDNGAFEKVYETENSVAHMVNFGYEEDLPNAGSNFRYYLRASIAGYGEHITDTIKVSSEPSLTIVGALTEFKQGVGLPSASQVYTLKALNLLEPIKISVPSPFEISLNGGDTWAANTVTIENTTPNFDQTINVRLNSNVAGNFNAVIKHSTMMADTVEIGAVGNVQSTPLPVSDLLVHFPLTADQNDDLAVRKNAIEVSPLQLNNYELADGSIAVIPPFGTTMGMGFAPKASGLWGSNDGGPGGNLNKSFYIEFTVNPKASNRVRLDSLLITASYYNTSSNTRFAVEYSTDGFATEGRSVTGGIGQGNILPSNANGAWSTPILLPNNTSANIASYHLALNNADGVWVEEGSTLTVRMYFSCGSTSAGRYAKIKDLILLGDFESTLFPEIVVTQELQSFIQTMGEASNTQNYTLKGLNLEDDITVTVPVPYQISTDNVTYDNTVTVLKDQVENTNLTLYVRLNGSTIGNYPASISHLSEGATAVEIPLSGNIIAAPLIPSLSVTGKLTQFIQTVGTPSAYQSLTITGDNLTHAISVIIPPGFEVSEDRMNWTNSSNVYLIQPTAGVVDKVLYVRMNNNNNQQVVASLLFNYQLLNEVIQLDGFGVVPMTVYPNPASNYLTISHPQLYTVGTINIYDVNGKRVSTKQTTSNTALTTLFIGNLKNGMYYVEFIRLNERKLLTFIKQ